MTKRITRNELRKDIASPRTCYIQPHLFTGPEGIWVVTVSQFCAPGQIPGEHRGGFKAVQPPSFPAVARGGGRKNASSTTPKANAAHMTSRPIRTIAISPGVRWDKLQFGCRDDAGNAKGVAPTVLSRQDADATFKKTGGLVDRDMDLKNETLGHAGHDGPRKTGNRDAVAVALRAEKLQGCVSLISKVLRGISWHGRVVFVASAP